MITQSKLQINKMHNCPLHINPELEIVLVKSGHVHISLGAAGFDLEGAQMTVIPPYRLHGFEVSGDIDSLVYLFPHSMAADFFNLCRNKDIKNQVFTLNPTTFDYILAATNSLDSAPSSFMEKSILYTLLADFMKGNSFTQMSLDTSGANRIIEYIFLNVKENITAKSVAGEFAISEGQLAEMLSNYIGLSFKDFLANMRVNNAMELLRTKNLSITEVAYESGFDTIRTFNRAFLKITGTTPSEYRKKFH